MLRRNLKGQTNRFYRGYSGADEIKVLPGVATCSFARLSRHRSWKAAAELHCRTLHLANQNSILHLTSNPQIIRGNMENWRITRFGHACRGKENTEMNNDIRDSLSRKRLTVSLQYVPRFKSEKETSSLGADIKS
jgi:hypothetical protein